MSTRNPLAALAMATLFARAFGGHDTAAPRRTRQPNRYRPHQSSRECLRRIGGAMWEQFKRDDRVRRGLPADKTTGA